MNGRKVPRDDSVKIRCRLGAMIISHTGTNDLQNKVNTLQKVRKVITAIHHDDQDFGEEIKEINRKLEIYLRVNGVSSLIIIILMVHALIEANYT